jgi:hypothetical protein
LQIQCHDTEEFGGALRLAHRGHERHAQVANDCSPTLVSAIAQNQRRQHVSLRRYYTNFSPPTELN